MIGRAIGAAKRAAAWASGLAASKTEVERSPAVGEGGEEIGRRVVVRRGEASVAFERVSPRGCVGVGGVAFRSGASASACVPWLGGVGTGVDFGGGRWVDWHVWLGSAASRAGAVEWSVVATTSRLRWRIGVPPHRDPGLNWLRRRTWRSGEASWASLAFGPRRSRIASSVGPFAVVVRLPEGDYAGSASRIVTESWRERVPALRSSVSEWTVRLDRPVPLPPRPGGERGQRERFEWVFSVADYESAQGAAERLELDIASIRADDGGAGWRPALRLRRAGVSGAGPWEALDHPSGEWRPWGSPGDDPPPGSIVEDAGPLDHLSAAVVLAGVGIFCASLLGRE